MLMKAVQNKRQSALASIYKFLVRTYLHINLLTEGKLHIEIVSDIGLAKT